MTEFENNMEKPVLIKNGRIIDPGSNIDTVSNLLLTNEGIQLIPSGIPLDQDATVIDASGMIICPGFVDLHCHLRQPGYEAKETIATGTLAAAHGGFTTVCCMPNTNPPLDTVEMVRSILSITETEGSIRVIPIACVTENRAGKTLAQLKDLAGAGIAGFSDDGSPVYDPAIMKQALIENLESGLPVSEHCEVPELAGKGVINEGRVAKELNVQGIPASAEEEMVARDIRLAEETGGWVHIAHASTAGSVALIRAGKQKGVHVTAEVTPHHLTLTEEEVLKQGNLAKVNPPLRTQQDVDALIEGLNDGTIDIIATDHAPHTAADKQGDLYKAAFGLSIFETALGSLMKLIRDGRISLPLLIEKMTCSPARLLINYPEITGTLVGTEKPDITIFDPEREWTVDAAAFASKGKNTPLDGVVLKGKVMATVYNGKVVYRDTSLRIK